MRKLLYSKNLPKPIFRYSPMVKTGPFYQMAGSIGIDPKTEKLVLGGVEYETRQILINLKKALSDFDLNLENLVLATIFTTDFDNFSLINKAWEDVFDENTLPPARSAIGVNALPLGAKVEIEFRLYKE